METTEPKKVYLDHCIETPGGKYRACTVEITSWAMVDNIMERIVAEATKAFGPREKVVSPTEPEFDLHRYPHLNSLPQSKEEAPIREDGTGSRYKWLDDHYVIDTAQLDKYNIDIEHLNHNIQPEEAGDPPVGNTVGDQEHHVTSSDDPASPITKEPLAEAKARVLYSVSSDQILGGTKYRKFVAEIDTQGLMWGRQLTDLLSSLGFDLHGNIYSEVGLFNRQLITFSQYQRRK